MPTYGPRYGTGWELVRWERALIYKTLVLTGLRKGEPASLTVGSLSLDGDVAFAQLDAADEKNREGNAVSIRDDLAEDLRQWLADKLARLQAEALRTGAPIPARLPADTPIFEVPDKLSKILNRDLTAAGIPKRDDRGRTLDVHALRHTFGTLLSMGGVAPRTAQAAMRHSKIDLTMSVYIDPKLLDVRAALNALPVLSLDRDTTEPETLQATGTEGPQRQPVQLVAPLVAPTEGHRTQTWTNVDKAGQTGTKEAHPKGIDATSNPDKRKGRLSTVDNRPLRVGATGLEPVTPSVSKCIDKWLSIAVFPVKIQEFHSIVPQKWPFARANENTRENTGFYEVAGKNAGNFWELSRLRGRLPRSRAPGPHGRGPWRFLA
jgi:hypothetical protein